MLSEEALARGLLEEVARQCEARVATATAQIEAAMRAQEAQETEWLAGEDSLAATQREAERRAHAGCDGGGWDCSCGCKGNAADANDCKVCGKHWWVDASIPWDGQWERGEPADPRATRGVAVSVALAPPPPAQGRVAGRTLFRCHIRGAAA